MAAATGEAAGVAGGTCTQVAGAVVASWATGAGVAVGSSPAAVRAAKRSSVRVSRAASRLRPRAAAPQAARPMSLAVVCAVSVFDIITIFVVAANK